MEREDEFDVNERPASPAADECASRNSQTQ